MKFAIDKSIEVALDREYGDKIRAELDAYCNPDNYYYAYGWVEPDIATVTAMTRSTLTTLLNPNLDHKTTK